MADEHLHHQGDADSGLDPATLPRTREPIEDAGATDGECAAWLEHNIGAGQDLGQFSVPVIARPALWRVLCSPRFQPPGTNRKPNPAKVSAYGRTMRSGGWEPLHPAGIWLTADGIVGDGGQRSRAALAQGVTLAVWMTFGVERRCMFVQDRGRKRSVPDGMRVAGVNAPSQHMMAAMAGLAAAIDAHQRGLVLVPVEAPDAIAFQRRHGERLVEAIHRGANVRAAIAAKASPSALALGFLRIAERTADREALGRYADALAHGAASRESAEHVLREGIRKGALRAGQYQEGMAKMVETAAIILAWNLSRERRAVRSMRPLIWRAVESPFPEALA